MGFEPGGHGPTAAQKPRAEREMASKAGKPASLIRGLPRRGNRLGGAIGGAAPGSKDSIPGKNFAPRGTRRCCGYLPLSAAIRDPG
jgi:hypothetical protein